MAKQALLFQPVSAYLGFAAGSYLGFNRDVATASVSSGRTLFLLSTE
jgi:hypothetical protein